MSVGHGYHETIDGTVYELFDVFPKGYRSNPLVLIVMFAPDGTQAWGALLHEGALSYLGAPSAAQQWALRETLGDQTGK